MAASITSTHWPAAKRSISLAKAALAKKLPDVGSCNCQQRVARRQPCRLAVDQVVQCDQVGYAYAVVAIKPRGDALHQVGGGLARHGGLRVHAAILSFASAGSRLASASARRRADAVADHAHRSTGVEWRAVRGSVDDVTRRESLCAVKLVRLEHAQADIHDDVGRALDHHRNQHQTILGGHGIQRLQEADGDAAAVVIHQQGSYPLGALDLFGVEGALDHAVVHGAGTHGSQRLDGVLAVGVSAHRQQMCGREALAAAGGDGADR